MYPKNASHGQKLESQITSFKQKHFLGSMIRIQEIWIKMQALDLRGQCEARLGEWVAMDYPADGDELGEVAVN